MLYQYSICFFRVDEDRIAAVGPDRACAEWLMRNGAFVKWKGAPEFLTDYNSLPPEGMKYFIQEIDATESSIMHYGGCKYISAIKFERCAYLQDEALQELSILKNSLQNLKIISCGNITDKGLKSLVILSNLQSLEVSDLIYLKSKEDCLSTLKSSLPNCKIEIQ
ncbi:ATP synthase subunit s [Blattella germanica]|nr:ATP synthase subunit s [Blattella germanica]